jgi:3-methyladenine DNA glycosylase Tag
LIRVSDGRTDPQRLVKHRGLPARTAVSDAMGKDLKRRGFSFVGTTICYAFMQADSVRGIGVLAALVARPSHLLDKSDGK